jgi:hypothetical protein
MSCSMRTRWIAAPVCLALMVLGGCGSNDRHPSAAHAKRQAASNHGSSHTITDDERACVGVEAIISHITVDTVRWSPGVNPFDQTISTRLAGRASQLAAQGSQATNPDIKFWIRATAASFTGVADAMTSRKRTRVEKAITQSRVAYKGLKQVCSLGDGH